MNWRKQASTKWVSIHMNRKRQFASYPQLITQNSFIRNSLLCDVFQGGKIWQVLLAFIVLPCDQNTTNSKHLPLESRKLFVGLKSVQLGHSAVRGCRIEIEIFTHFHHPLKHQDAILYHIISYIKEGVCLNWTQQRQEKGKKSQRQGSIRLALFELYTLR